jgi:hypothetical protein
MNENLLRWKARLGSSKRIAVILIIGTFVFSIPIITDLEAALKNVKGPQSIKIEQLVGGTIGAGQYVELSGYPMYDVGYQETSSYGTVLAVYYFLVDADTATTVLVKSPATEIQSGKLPLEKVSLTGITRISPGDIQEALQTDMADPLFVGIRLQPDIFLAEGEAPPNLFPTAGKLMGIGILFLVCMATFFFPHTIFAVKPLETPNPASQRKIALPIVRATGRFARITQQEPKLQFSQYTKKFNGAIANLIPLEPGRLLIFIRYVTKTSLYGVVTISKTETHWGVIINPENLIDIEPGKQYGWRDYWAVRFRYKGTDKKENTLLVSFSSLELQTEVVKSLREKGLAVGSGINEAVMTM